MPRRTRCDIGTVLVHINDLLTPKRVSGGWISLQLPSPPKASWKSVELQRATGKKNTQRRASRQNAPQNILEWTKYHTYEQTSPDNQRKKRAALFTSSPPTVVIQGSIKSSPCFLFCMIRSSLFQGSVALFVWDLSSVQ